MPLALGMSGRAPAERQHTRPIVSCLIDLGHLTPLFRSQGENKRDKCGFDRQEVDLVLDRLHHLAPEMSHLSEQWVTLTQCTKRARILMRDLVQRIFAGEVNDIGRAEAGRGFNALRIDIRKVLSPRM